ncbi:DUF262 domain-containing protein [Yersinia enterocolitica]
MTVSVAICSVADLLTGKQIKTSTCDTISSNFSIPEYQRPYIWQDRQIEKLLRDIAEHQALSSTMPYYLGSVILHADGERLNIIDGQQRLTTLALMAHLNGQFTDFPLHYNSPISQRQIIHNLTWLKQHSGEWLELIDFNLLQFSLVITRSEDQAYQFFETQNTGGVRLSGDQIIKAHHLRAIGEKDKLSVDHFARRWEALGDLSNIVDLLLRGRYWQHLHFREYPQHNQKALIRNCIVNELAENTGKGGDTAFGRITRTYSTDGAESLSQAQVGYDLRQPLNSGINTIHYLQYFENLRQTYLLHGEINTTPKGFSDFYYHFICKLEGCSYLKQLLDTALLLYISQFGQKNLDVAVKKLFRVIYSRRIENQTAVKERSIPAFIQETPVLDWIAASFTIEQLFSKLDGFDLKVDSNGLGEGDNTVKKRFVVRVVEYFGLQIGQCDLKTQFGPNFDKHIKGLEVGNE